MCDFEQNECQFQGKIYQKYCGNSKKVTFHNKQYLLGLTFLSRCLYFISHRFKLAL